MLFLARTLKGPLSSNEATILTNYFTDTSILLLQVFACILAKPQHTLLVSLTFSHALSRTAFSNIWTQKKLRVLCYTLPDCGIERERDWETDVALYCAAPRPKL